MIRLIPQTSNKNCEGVHVLVPIEDLGETGPEHDGIPPKSDVIDDSNFDLKSVYMLFDGAFQTQLFKDFQHIKL